MNKDNQLPVRASTKNLPGIPILPGRNTPMIQSGPPKNVPPPPAPNPAVQEKPKGN